MSIALGSLAPHGSRRRRFAQRWLRPVLLRIPVLRQRLLRAAAIHREERLLRKSWLRHSAENLDEYLVSGYQDPRINVQSILVRHFLVQRLFGPAFDDLEREELAAAVEMNETARSRAAAAGVVVKATSNPEKRNASREVFAAIDEPAARFSGRWHAALEGRSTTRIRVLEFACGSANDYRSWVDYGIAPYLDYTGVDITANNIENAQRRFPAVDFRLGSVLSLPDADRSFDYVVASDLFEHLSLEAMDVALGQAVRLARRGLALTFFIMDERPEHVEVPKRRYHVNELSAAQMRRWLEARYRTVRMVPIARYLTDDYGWAQTYNPHAWSIFAEDPI